MPDLNKILSEVRYVVIGGTATSLYMPLRTTKDVSVGRLTPVQSPRELI